MRLGGIDHVVAILQPMPHQRVDEIGRVLAIAVDEQHRAEPRMVESGEQGGFLAEIARERDHLHVEMRSRQLARDREGGIAAAIVHIDHLATQRALLLQLPRHLGQAAHAAPRARPPR